MTTVLEALNQGLRDCLGSSKDVFLLGEDILDPYGGAFKVVRGLSTDFPDRVLTTPISEAGIVGTGVGMALRGLRPVVEIMFGDFITLASDQLINHAAKFRWMSDDRVRVPLVVRTPMGGGRGYGPTHSQSLEKHFLGAPGLRTVAVNALGDPAALLRAAVLDDDDPLLFVEHKALYAVELWEGRAADEFERSSSGGRYPTHRLRVRGAPAPVLTMAAYGYMAELAAEALQQLAYQHEVFGELLVPTQLSPFQRDEVLDSARGTGRLLTVEEGGGAWGWGAEVVASASAGQAGLRTGRVAAVDMPIPAAGPLERGVLPDVDAIKAAALALMSDG